MKNPYVPDIAVIEKIKEERGNVKIFAIRLLDRKRQKSFKFIPGQFVEVSVFGVGEAPFSICSSPFNKNFFEIAVKIRGNVTNALFRLKEGDFVGVRGPYGNGFPIQKFENKNIVIVAGGIGIAPLKSLIEYIKVKRKKFEKIWFFYGSKQPADIVFKTDVEKLREIENFNLILTVDNSTPEWKGYVGPVTTILDKIEIKTPHENIVGISCGPPIMMKLVTESFQKMKLRDDQMFLSMERLMQCGIGKCGHCNIGKKYVCQDGPVFTYQELKGLTEKVW